MYKKIYLIFSSSVILALYKHFEVKLMQLTSINSEYTKEDKKLLESFLLIIELPKKNAGLL